MLSEIVPESYRVDYKTGYDLWALTTEDIGYLFHHYTSEFTEFIDSWDESGKPDISEKVSLAFPKLFTACIALSTREKPLARAIKGASQLPLPVQLESLDRVFSLTFPRGEETEVEHIKKTYGTIAAIWKILSPHSASG